MSQRSRFSGVFHWLFAAPEWSSWQQDLYHHFQLALTPASKSASCVLWVFVLIIGKHAPPKGVYRFNPPRAASAGAAPLFDHREKGRAIHRKIYVIFYCAPHRSGRLKPRSRWGGARRKVLIVGLS